MLRLLALLVLLSSCASTDPLWTEQQVREQYEALVVGCANAGGAIVLTRQSATRAKLDLPPTLWEMRSARCGRLN